MGFRLHKGHPIDQEVRRVGDHQLELAIAGLQTIGSPEGDAAVHVARRHIKKVRALLRLVRPALGDRCAPVNLRLRAINRLLAPIADANAAVETLARLSRKYPGELNGEMLSALQASVVRRSAVFDEEAALEGTLETAAALLRAERDAVGRWHVKNSGFRAIAPGLERSVRDTRAAMLKALAHPTMAHYHRWRQRVKDLWLQIRLLQPRCGDALTVDEQRLEALDGCLGEYRDCALLEEALESDTALERSDAQRCRLLLHRYQRELVAQAHALGRALHRETPRQFMTRVHRQWRTVARETRGAQRGRSWPRVA